MFFKIFYFLFIYFLPNHQDDPDHLNQIPFIFCEFFPFSFFGPRESSFLSIIFQITYFIFHLHCCCFLFFQNHYYQKKIMKNCFYFIFSNFNSFLLKMMTCLFVLIFFSKQRLYWDFNSVLLWILDYYFELQFNCFYFGSSIVEKSPPS